MEYADKLALLIAKKNYWTNEKRVEFFNGFTPPNPKFGPEWNVVWEVADEGYYVLDTSEFEDVVLYGSDGKKYFMYNMPGEHDWDIFREWYVAGYNTGQWRTEAPVFSELFELDGQQWRFCVTAPPQGEFGQNKWDELADAVDETWVKTLIRDTGVGAKSLYAITQKYEVGMTQQIFCAAGQWRNTTGAYWGYPRMFVETYDRAMKIGLAMTKRITLQKFGVFKLAHEGVTEIADGTKSPFDTPEIHALMEQEWKL